MKQELAKASCCLRSEDSCRIITRVSFQSCEGQRSQKERINSSWFPYRSRIVLEKESWRNQNMEQRNPEQLSEFKTGLQEMETGLGFRMELCLTRHGVA